MLIFAAKPLTTTDFGALGLMFFLAIGMLRLLSFMIKKKFETDKKEEGKSAKVSDEIAALTKKVDEMHEKICLLLDKPVNKKLEK